MFKAKATFTGINSLGYIHGQSYQIIVHAMQGGAIIIERDVFGKPEGSCPYGSLKAFLQNWNSIEVV